MTRIEILEAFYKAVKELYYSKFFDRFGAQVGQAFSRAEDQLKETERRIDDDQNRHGR
jgi:hypothetical protein